jgi:hypothetical protein
LEELRDAHPVLIILLASFLASIFAEIVNPTATANIFLPFLAVVVRETKQIGDPMTVTNKHKKN